MTSALLLLNIYYSFSPTFPSACANPETLRYDICQWSSLVPTFLLPPTLPLLIPPSPACTSSCSVSSTAQRRYGQPFPACRLFASFLTHLSGFISRLKRSDSSFFFWSELSTPLARLTLMNILFRPQVLMKICLRSIWMVEYASLHFLFHAALPTSQSSLAQCPCAPLL